METTNWQSEPDGRGTFSLIFSCIITLVFCVWSALHLNVPPPNSSSKRRALEKTCWVFYGIFAPELVVATAASQYIAARWLKREIEMDNEYKEKTVGSGGETWTMTQCFNAVMGGLTVTGPQGRFTLSAEGTRLLSFIDALPTIATSQIQDKSKADGLAKSVVCIQAAWMMAQIIARLINGLPVSLLEINTCGHVICAFVLYLLWWSKPLDLQDPLILEGSAFEEMLPFMFASSQIGADSRTGINKLRCLRYVGPAEVDHPQELKQDSTLIFSEISIGSTGLRDMSEFLGRKASFGGKDHAFLFKVGVGEISPPCLSYFADEYQSLRLRHGEVYCRQFMAPQQESGEIFSTEYLSLIIKGADRIWTKLAARPSYARYFFTASPTIKSYFIGETDYLIKSAPNFPSLTNLSLGQVNISRDTLRYVFGFTAMAYGGLHLSGWNHHFPSRVERMLWIVSSIAITGSGMLLWAFFAMRKLLRKTPPVQGEPDPVLKWIYCGIIFMLVLVRVFLVVEAFISLRDAPTLLYTTPEWSDFFPHLG
ncbi:hypothetical protein S7711_01618 [Stachybotrys chartarum IBT 7711]|uniref:Uncharacterized protein n=1 Tax=Stachybotrys chartarum (strain CBS 109288 / IBT 7711) TaxID=1280523 RepID=A0A084BC93_STACB|nr:hypothetical protein S7711_01618 [Stachybotrys chartarum IBT 7711]